MSVSVDDWLETELALAPEIIELGLERVKRVAQRMELLPLGCPAIVVGGTNGKGSCIAALESLYTKAGYQAFCYTSPHLFRFNERLRFGGEDLSDERIIESFQAVKSAKNNDALTYFEYATLAALHAIKDLQPDIALLEVGLGGRLDAVNIVDADISIVTSIGLDHTDWLGDSREAIAYEKAGIFRPAQVAVCGDISPPEPIRQQADELGTHLSQLGEDWFVTDNDSGWQWSRSRASESDSPVGSLELQIPGQLPSAYQRNQGAAVTAIQEMNRLHPEITVSNAQVLTGLESIQVSGRCERRNYETEDGRVVPLILDVAHNVEACEVLGEFLRERFPGRSAIAVFSALQGKPVPEMVQLLSPYMQRWYCADLGVPRALSSADLAAGLKKGLLAQSESSSLRIMSNLRAAFVAATSAENNEAPVVVFGSFHSVEQCYQWL